MLKFAERGILDAAKNSGLDNNHQLTMGLTEWDQLTVLYDVAKGLLHMHGQSIIHRDLAARNVLMKETGDSGVIWKIGDLGMSREVEVKNYYRVCNGAQVPWFWLSPEAQQTNTYDSASDVWAYGVLWYGVVTWGADPFSHLKTAQYTEIMSNVKQGYLKLIASIPESPSKDIAKLIFVEKETRIDVDGLLAAVERARLQKYEEDNVASFSETASKEFKTFKIEIPSPGGVKRYQIEIDFQKLLEESLSWKNIEFLLDYFSTVAHVTPNNKNVSAVMQTELDKKIVTIVDGVQFTALRFSQETFMRAINIEHFNSIDSSECFINKGIPRFHSVDRTMPFIPFHPGRDTFSKHNKMQDTTKDKAKLKEFKKASFKASNMVVYRMMKQIHDTMKVNAHTLAVDYEAGAVYRPIYGPL